MIVDENGIIQKSKDARNASRAGAIRDEISLWEAEKFASDNGTGSHESMDDFLTRLKDRGLISEDDIQTIKDTRELQIGKETIKFPSDAKTLVQAFKDRKIKVGDYSNYNDYVNESKTYTTETNENGWTDQKYTATKNTYWQVLGLDETGEKLMLISQSPIKKEMKTSDTAEAWETTPYLVLKGAYGYVNCKQILNNGSGIYSTSLGKAESLTAEEINRLIGVTVDYKNKTVYDANYAKSYWLASPAVGAFSGDAGFGRGDVYDGYVSAVGSLFYSYGRWYAGSFGVRPVVYLESNVTVEDLHTIDGQEEDWSAYSTSNLLVASSDASN